MSFRDVDLGEVYTIAGIVALCFAPAIVFIVVAALLGAWWRW